MADGEAYNLDVWASAEDVETEVSDLMQCYENPTAADYLDMAEGVVSAAGLQRGGKPVPQAAFWRLVALRLVEISRGPLGVVALVNAAWLATIGYGAAGSVAY